jgi:hypothetical protein
MGGLNANLIDLGIMPRFIIGRYELVSVVDKLITY